MRDEFIEQTAKDYNIEYDIVKSIYIKHKDTFYDKLESYIENRLEYYRNFRKCKILGYREIK